MRHHYRRLMEIDASPPTVQDRNDRVDRDKEREKNRIDSGQAKPIPRHKKEELRKILKENAKLVEAVAELRNTWGKLSMFVLDRGPPTIPTKKFHVKSRRELIKENMVIK